MCGVCSHEGWKRQRLVVQKDGEWLCRLCAGAEPGRRDRYLLKKRGGSRPTLLNAGSASGRRSSMPPRVASAHWRGVALGY